MINIKKTLCSVNTDVRNFKKNVTIAPTNIRTDHFKLENFHSVIFITKIISQLLTFVKFTLLDILTHFNFLIDSLFDFLFEKFYEVK